MENLSPAKQPIIIPVSISIPEYLRDHCYEGRAVLPAAEALQILARSLPRDIDHCDPLIQEGGEFSRLLQIDPGVNTLLLFHEIRLSYEGKMQSRLNTLHSGRQTQLNRRITHVSVNFSSGETYRQRERQTPKTSVDADPWKGPLFIFSCQQLYRDLVPFGLSYRNVITDVTLDGSGAGAGVSGGEIREAIGPLGSPFPFDAAMHVACAWGQRYGNIVAFPVGFERREILTPTSAGETYLCRVIPLAGEGSFLRFNICLYDEKRKLVEIILGLKMRDISGGRLKPPAWVRKGVECD
jgi:hypothetical protein